MLPFEIAVALYLAGTLGFAALLFLRPKVAAVVPDWIARLGWVVHGLGLAMLWGRAGLWHPPWVNPAESALYLSWCLMGAQVWVAVRYRWPWAGLLICPMAGAWAWAALPTVSSIGAQPWSLFLERSPWVLCHGFFGGLAAGALIVSSLLAIFAWVKTKDNSASLLSGAVALLLLVLLVFDPGAGPHVAWVLAMGGSAVGLSLLGIEAALSWSEMREMEILERAAAEALLKGRKPRRLPESVVRHSRGIGKIARAVAGAAWLSAAGFLWELQRGGPESWAAPKAVLALVLYFDVLAFSWVREPEWIDARLPAIEKLDRWTYLMTLYGFVFLGAEWLTGAAWAYATQGSFWETGAKAVWLLVSGLLYWVALHLPRCEKRTAIVVMLGAVAIGMTLIGTGPHPFLIGQ